MADDQSQPWSHYHKALDQMNKPASDLSRIETLGWGYDPDKLDPKVNGKAGASPGQGVQPVAEDLDQEMLETLTFLSPGERLDLSIEKVIGRAVLDLPALGFTEAFARSSIAVKGRGRASVEKMMSGTGQRISVPTTLQKIKRTLVGGQKMAEEQTYGIEDQDKED